MGLNYIGWRLLDTGRRDAAANMALDETLLEARAAGSSPDTLRFLQFTPPAVLVGFHQSLGDEVRLDFCRGAGIDVNRRVTGGGAIYFDESQLGWEIIAGAASLEAGVPNERFFRRLSEPVVRALRRLGVRAAFRPRNDIEVRGRKISGTGGTSYGDAFLFQGTLLVDFDVAKMMRALRTPVEKLKRHELESVAERVTCLKEELGVAPDVRDVKESLVKTFEETFNIRLVPGDLTAEEKRLYEEKLPKFRSDAWIDRVKALADNPGAVAGTWKAKTGTVKVVLVPDLARRRLKQTLVVGDFFCAPRRAVWDLEAVLKDAPLDRDTLAARINVFFANPEPPVAGITAADIIGALDRAWAKLQLTAYDIPPRLANDVFLVNSTFETLTRERPAVLLLPYCAKSPACGYRYSRECAECDGCSVGAAYQLAREHGLNVTTITSFEDLIATLAELKRKGVRSYVGCCCEQFYVKYIEDFEAARLPAALVNIHNETCYDLNLARAAYAGEFENQTELNLPLLKKVLDAL